MVRVQSRLICNGVDTQVLAVVQVIMTGFCQGAGYAPGCECVGTVQAAKE